MLLCGFVKPMKQKRQGTVMSLLLLELGSGRLVEGLLMMWIGWVYPCY